MSAASWKVRGGKASGSTMMHKYNSLIGLMATTCQQTNKKTFISYHSQVTWDVNHWSRECQPTRPWPLWTDDITWHHLLPFNLAVWQSDRRDSNILMDRSCVSLFPSRWSFLLYSFFAPWFICFCLFFLFVLFVLFVYLVPFIFFIVHWFDCSIFKIYWFVLNRSFVDLFVNNILHVYEVSAFCSFLPVNLSVTD